MPVMVSVDGRTLRALLDLADHSRDVATTTDYPGLSVVIPDYLYQRYLTYQAIDSSPPIEPKKSGAKK
jgi:hypothetical protein